MFCALIGIALIHPTGVELPGPPLAGWRASAQQTIRPAGIFDYMNGAGELYLAYSFKELYVRDYTKTGEPRIALEVYRMPNSADAYGLFSQDRVGKAMRIGQGAVYASGLLIAWQGNYFIRVLADRETPGGKQLAVELAKRTVKLCGPAGKPPAALKWLPKTGLEPTSVHFFHKHALLNYFHFVASENLLNLSSKTDAVMGTYTSGSGKSLALVVGHPSESAARSAWGRFKREYLKGLKPSGKYSLVRLENGKWLAGLAYGRRVMIVLESPNRAACSNLIERLRKAG